MLLEEFDFDQSAVIEPWFVHQPVEGFPETVVSIFSHTLFDSIANFLCGKVIAETKDVWNRPPLRLGLCALPKIFWNPVRKKAVCET